MRQTQKIYGYNGRKLDTLVKWIDITDNQTNQMWKELWKKSRWKYGKIR